MLEFQNIKKTVGTSTHIYPSSFVLTPGSFNVLLGSTLAGKTTLMRLMAGLDAPTSGKILSNRHDVTGVHVAKRSVAMVYQSFINYPNFTVFQNIASPMRAAKKSEDEIQSRVAELAKMLNLEKFLTRYPAELSGGQQQRTALGRALAKEAELLLLDEPLVNLDYKLREELREELPELVRDQNRTVVYSTTEPSEALFLKGQTLTMSEGCITQVGKTLEVYRQPVNVTSAAVFSYPPMNTVHIKKNGNRLIHPSFSVDVSAPYAAVDDGDYQMAFRAYALSIDKPAAPAFASFEGSVVFTELSGSESYVHIDFYGNNWLMQSHKILEYELNQPIHFYLNLSLIFLFDTDGKNALVEMNHG